MIKLIKGTKIKGNKRYLLNIIGIPNISISLILKITKGAASLAIFLLCLSLPAMNKAKSNESPAPEPP